MKYEVVTDSSANLDDAIIEKYNITVVSLSYYINDIEYKSYVKGDKSYLNEFYSYLRSRENIKTSLASPSDFFEAFENILKNGKDILCVCVSSGISGTYQAACVAADMLLKDYPERKIRIVNSLGASLGVGILACYACIMGEEGKSIDEVASYLDEKSHFMRNLFVVDDLFFLNRGGRLSVSNAILGSLFKIKPLLYGDKEGKVSLIKKIRGRKQSLDILVQTFKESVVDVENQIVGISHGDCLEDAIYVKEQLESFCKPKEIMTVVTEPVMVTHGGPGMLGLFFIGNEK